MKCDYCQTENPEYRNFCIKCTNPLNDEARRLFPELIKRRHRIPDESTVYGYDCPTGKCEM